MLSIIAQVNVLLRCISIWRLLKSSSFFALPSSPLQSRPMSPSRPPLLLLSRKSALEVNPDTGPLCRPLHIKIAETTRKVTAVRAEEAFSRQTPGDIGRQPICWQSERRWNGLRGRHGHKERMRRERNNKAGNIQKGTGNFTFKTRGAGGAIEDTIVDFAC